MANVDKCLLFYLKYAAEMERLYEEEEPSLEGLPDPAQILEKLNRVGNAANREVTRLLDACAPGIETHFRPICAIERVPTNLEKTWELKFRIAPKRTSTSKGPSPGSSKSSRLPCGEAVCDRRDTLPVNLGYALVFMVLRT